MLNLRGKQKKEYLLFPKSSNHELFQSFKTIELIIKQHLKRGRKPYTSEFSMFGVFQIMWSKTIGGKKSSHQLFLCHIHCRVPLNQTILLLDSSRICCFGCLMGSSVLFRHYFIFKDSPLVTAEDPASFILKITCPH